MASISLTNVRSFVDSNLGTLCAEVLTWRSTGLIPSGALLGQVAKACEDAGFNHDAFQQAESLVVTAALKVVVEAPAAELNREALSAS